jgi:hypothetical protein
MWRPLLGAVVGFVAGVGLTALLLRGTWAAVARLKEPLLFEMNPDVIYLTVVLGAGFGALCGALTGVTAALLREWRRGRPTA